MEGQETFDMSLFATPIRIAAYTKFIFLNRKYCPNTKGNKIKHLIEVCLDENTSDTKVIKWIQSEPEYSEEEWLSSLESNRRFEISMNDR